MDLELEAKKLREKKLQELSEKRADEDEQKTKERMKSILSDRDAALQSIYDYQDKTGVPSKNETEKHFFEIETKLN